MRVGQIATGLMHPERGYADLFNFFDPDSYLTTQALALAGNSYLDDQVFLLLFLRVKFVLGEKYVL